MRDYEEIDFEIWLGAGFWDRPPSIQVILNNELINNITLDKQGVSKIKFRRRLKFNHQHTLTINRTGKTDDQTVVDPTSGEMIDQIAWLEKLIIDNIDIQNIVWSKSVYYPEFPEPWATEQRQLGIDLEYPVISGTHWGHNGYWELKFTSPFYRFLIQEMQ